MGRPEADLTDVLLGHMESFRDVVAEGTVGEKRRFIRAFTRRMVLDPQTGKGRAEVFLLPKETALTDLSATADSSFKMVAGARSVSNALPFLPRALVIDYPALRRGKAA